MSEDYGETFVRFRTHAEHVFRAFGPKEAAHPTVGLPCLACGKRFVAGDVTTLLPLGPGGDPEARERARAGRWYSAIAVELHWDCVTGGT